MNRKQAEEKGYTFTGSYSHDKEEMKQRAKEERAKGNKAIVVNVPPSRYSRGHGGMGYAVHIIESEKNIALRNKAIRENKITTLKSQIKLAKEQLVNLESELANV